MLRVVLSGLLVIVVGCGGAVEVTGGGGAGGASGGTGGARGVPELGVLLWHLVLQTRRALLRRTELGLLRAPVHDTGERYLPHGMQWMCVQLARHPHRDAEWRSTDRVLARRRSRLQRRS